ncbi:MAG: cysteine desulfurase [Candidatus Hydrogenedentota bacterium]
MLTETTTYPIKSIRADFPVFHEVFPHGKPLVYLDNAATSQKPQQVIDAIAHYYTAENSNVHRGIHYLSQLATEKYDATREKVQRFFNAPSPNNIIFTSGNTEALNLVAHSYGEAFLKEDDEVIISEMEHHSNIVPWQMACERTGATLRIAPINDKGEIILEEFEAMLSEKTKFVGIVYVSNALGTINPVKQITKMAHDVGAVVMLDSAQAAPHLRIDVQDINCDFLSIAPHKMCGPTGIGALYGKAELLEKMPPFKGGGDMILSVTFEKTVYNEVPFKFEAGTPNIAGVIGLGAAIDYMMNIGLDNIAAHEAELLAYGTEQLQTVDGLKFIGTADNKAGVMGFIMDSAHPHDIGQILDGEGIAIRAGHHCAQPVMKHFGIPATARASVALYNTKEDIDALVTALAKVNEMFG